MGWINWPDNEDLSIEFMRLLGAAQEGGSTVSECFLTASRIDPKDDDCWHREWKKTADASNVRGNTPFSGGQMLTRKATGFVPSTTIRRPRSAWIFLTK